MILDVAVVAAALLVTLLWLGYDMARPVLAGIVTAGGGWRGGQARCGGCVRKIREMLTKHRGVERVAGDTSAGGTVNRERRRWRRRRT